MPCAPRFRFAEPLTEKFWIGTGVNDRYARRDGRRRVLGYLGFTLPPQQRPHWRARLHAWRGVLEASAVPVLHAEGEAHR
jgi:hypothetical protein